MLFRRMSSWSASLTVHAIVLLVLGALWFIEVSEEAVACPGSATLQHPVVRSPVVCFDRPKIADDHPPIVPEEFVWADVVNTAIEVVENTWPENELAALVEGDSFEAAREPSARGLNKAIGARGGLEGRPGAYAKRFG